MPEKKSSKLKFNWRLYSNFQMQNGQKHFSQFDSLTIYAIFFFLSSMFYGMNIVSQKVNSKMFQVKKNYIFTDNF